ncbi:MAG: iron chelate uptake ABC transporter family permease subunit [Planctomycetota bacterium]
MIAFIDHEWMMQDGWMLLAAILCAASAAILGNYLVLRKMSMLGDAISHAVLPGIAAAFVLTSSREGPGMFIGAVVVGLLTAVFTEWIRGAGRVDEGASMGVVFTTLFALGLVLIVRAADAVDLGPDCVLYGAIEWMPWAPLVPGTIIPIPIAKLATVFVLNVVFVVLFYKELKLSSFDPSLATSMGINARWMHYLLMIMVSLTAVASFEAVGSVLVVAMLIVPASTAYLLTNRLSFMILLSTLLAVLAAVGGYYMATRGPALIGFKSTTVAGTMAVASGILLVTAAVFSPTQGVLIRWVRRQRMSFGILCDDITATLYRLNERGQAIPSSHQLAAQLMAGRVSFAMAKWHLVRAGELETDPAWSLTDRGRKRALELVRSHRLWEHYLVNAADRDADRIHDQAEEFEHFTDRLLRDRLDAVADGAGVDPHGTAIPEEKELS